MQSDCRQGPKEEQAPRVNQRLSQSTICLKFGTRLVPKRDYAEAENTCSPYEDGGVDGGAISHCAHKLNVPSTDFILLYYIICFGRKTPYSTPPSILLRLYSSVSTPPSLLLRLYSSVSTPPSLLLLIYSSYILLLTHSPLHTPPIYSSYILLLTTLLLPHPSSTP